MLRGKGGLEWFGMCGVLQWYVVCRSMLGSKKAEQREVVLAKHMATSHQLHPAEPVQPLMPFLSCRPCMQEPWVMYQWGM